MQAYDVPGCCDCVGRLWGCLSEHNCTHLRLNCWSQCSWYCFSLTLKAELDGSSGCCWYIAGQVLRLKLMRLGVTIIGNVRGAYGRLAA